MVREKVGTPALDRWNRHPSVWYTESFANVLDIGQHAYLFYATAIQSNSGMRKVQPLCLHKVR